MRDLRQNEIEALLKLTKKKGVEKLKVAIYARKSREDELGTSISTQVDACTRFIERYNFLFETSEEFIFSEDNVSGFFLEHRKEYSKMMDLVDSGKVHVVLTMKIDRFSRDAANIAKYIEHITQAGAYFIAGDDHGDNTAAGILIKQIMWATNEFVARRSVEDAMKVRVKLSRDGYSVGGVGNYGYRIVKRKYLIEPMEAIAVNLIFDMVLKGYSYQEIADELEIKGFKPRKSERFSQSTLHDILTNERLYGLHIWNHKQKPRRKNRVLKEEFEEVHSEFAVPEPIISKDKFDRVQQILTGRMIPKRNEGHEPYLLTGLIYCEVCGTPMVGSSKAGGHSKTKIRYYTCKHHTTKTGHKCPTKDVNATHLENNIKHLMNDLIDQHLLKHGVSKAVIDRTMKEDRLTLNRLNRELKSYEDTVSGLVLGLARIDTIDTDHVKESIQRDLEKYDTLIKSTSNLIHQIEERISSITGSISTAYRSNTDWMKDDRLGRLLIHSIITSIRVNDKGISIDIKD
jgi:site-specific DNA recombinase